MLVTSRSKIQGLEVKVREIEAGGLELKRTMKEATKSEYAISQKLAYVTPSFKGKTECIDHVCTRIKLHTHLDIVNTKISAT
jgi:hypothetical protein